MGMSTESLFQIQTKSLFKIFEHTGESNIEYNKPGTDSVQVGVLKRGGVKVPEKYLLSAIHVHYPTAYTKDGVNVKTEFGSAEEVEQSEGA